VGPYQTSHKIVKEARRLLVKGRYLNSAELLEGLAATGANDPYVFFYLAVDYLYLNDFQKAQRAMGKLEASWSSMVYYQQLKSFLSLKSAGDKAAAVRSYTELAARFTGDARTQRSLNRLINAGDFQGFQRESRLSDFVEIPKPPRPSVSSRHRRIEIHRAGDRGARTGIRFQVRIMIAAGITVAVAALVLAGISLGLGGFNGLSDILQRKSADTGPVDRVSLDPTSYDLVTGTSRGGGALFYYSAQALVSDFNRAKSLIKRGGYNESLAILNKINYSNVSFSVKEKTGFLIRWITHVEERTYDPVPYEEVAAKPELYLGYALRWRGRVANMIRRQETVSFTLLVDARGKDTFTGVVEVFFDETRKELVNGASVTVLGVLTSVVGRQGRLYLVAREIDVDR
jgi:hypothetical protein